MANAEDPKQSPRVIKAFRDDGVFPLLHVYAEADGTIAAVLGPLVPAHEFKKHATGHRTAAGEGAFPNWARRGLSDADDPRDGKMQIRSLEASVSLPGSIPSLHMQWIARKDA